VRKAIAYAIDRETIAKQIYQGAATAQYTDFLGDILDPSAEVYKYDPDMARKLLKDANWNSADVILLDNTAPVAGAAADPIGDAENAAYQQWLQDVGIKSQVRLSPDSASFSDLTLNGNFDCYENPHRRYDTYGPLEMKIYLLSSPRNYANWKSADADALVAQAVGETDPQKYIAAAKKLSILAANQCPYIPTKASLWGIVSRKQFVGFTPIGEAYFAHTKPYNWDVVG
jgi:ABC-type transport system substrate-binding protein